MAERITIDAIQDTNLRRMVHDLLVQRAKYGQQKREAEEMEKAASAAVIPLLQKLGIKNLYATDGDGELKQFVLSRGVNTSIKRTRLIELMVDPGIIDMATERTEYFSLQVRGIKTNDSESDAASV